MGGSRVFTKVAASGFSLRSAHARMLVDAQKDARQRGHGQRNGILNVNQIGEFISMITAGRDGNSLRSD
jgi:hypothetical protein